MAQLCTNSATTFWAPSSCGNYLVDFELCERDNLWYPAFGQTYLPFSEHEKGVSEDELFDRFNEWCEENID